MSSQPQTHTLNPDAISHLKSQLPAKPIMELAFMPYGIIRRSYNENGAVEVIVSPEDVALALSQRESRWETGILGPNTLFMAEINGTRIVAEYRPPQVTGVWLEGTPTPLRVPMPGLVLIRRSAKNAPQHYRLFAAKKRPDAHSMKLYRAPLPNVYADGDICWGSVPKPEVVNSASLEADWTMLLGSGFGNHGGLSLSKKHKSDVRKLLIELDAKKAKRYPLSDLVEHRLSLRQELYNER